MSVYQGTIDGSANSGDRRSRRVRWRGVELFAMILGFIVFWPIGLAILFLKVWQKREGRPDQDLVDFVHERSSEMRGRCMAKRSQWGAADWGRPEWKPFSGPRPTGNSAFDDWRSAELARLEEERQKLVQAERDFADHLDKLRRARDREEFDRFMTERQMKQGSQQQAPDSSPQI